jgi:hypothetical protein
MTSLHIDDDAIPNLDGKIAVITGTDCPQKESFAQ